MTADDVAEDRQALRDAVARFAKDRFPFTPHRAVGAAFTGGVEGLWRGLADELCVLGAGGFGEHDGEATLADACVVIEELGRELLAEPYVSTVMGGGQWLRHADTPIARDVLGELDRGRAIVVVAGASQDPADAPLRVRREGATVTIDGLAGLVACARWATHVVAVGMNDGVTNVALVPVGARGLSLREVVTMDGDRAADVSFERVELPLERLLIEGSAAAATEAFVHDCVTTGLCAEALGVMRRLCVDTIAYARQRRQFGRAIADNQAIRHRIVDMHIQLEQSIAATQAAVDSLTVDRQGRARAVSVAKWQVSGACRSVGESAIQIHGAIGTTDELPIGHFFKRALVIAHRGGTTDDHRRRFESLSFA